MARKALIGLAAALALGVALVLVAALVQAVRFRNHPKRTSVQAFFSSERLDKLVVRWLILRNGTPSYDRQIRVWIYQPDVVRDNSWNRRLLVADLKSLSPNMRAFFLSRYPLSPDQELLPLIREALFAKKSVSVLWLLNENASPAARRLRAEWVRSLQAAPTDVEAFFKTIPHVMGSPHQLLPLVRAFWPTLSPRQRETGLDSIAMSIDLDAESSIQILQWLDEILRDPTQGQPHRVARMMSGQV